MGSYTILQPRQVEWIEKSLQYESFYRTYGYAFLQEHGLIDPVGEGLSQVETTVFKKMKPGRISYGLQDLPDAVVRLDTVDSKIAVIATKILVNQQHVDAWVNNTANIASGTTLPNVMISEQIQTLFNQVDGFIFWGSAYRSELQRDVGKWEGSAEFTGMFNAFTAKGAGAGSDENMTAAGDYVATIDSYITSLKDAGWDSDQYWIFSDLSTWASAAKGNNFSSTTLTTERDRVIQRTDIAAWLSSPNMYDGTNSRFVVTSPARSMTAKERTARTRPYRLLEGYKFRVFPLFGGGLDANMNYQIAIVWSGILEKTHDSAIYRSGNLTLA